MVYRILLTGIGISLLIFAFAMAHPHFTGYSGAPGSFGNCASSCHGSPGGTIEVTGFPTEYAPGSTYTLAISHNGGSSIAGLNGSCRIGTGSDNAGLIASGTNTVAYSISGETNGIAMSSTDLDNGTFSWTAPDVGTGDVTLYLAGTQGGFSGLNSELIFVATEGEISCGDVNNDNDINILDIVTLINYKYKGGTAPNCPSCNK